MDINKSCYIQIEEDIQTKENSKMYSKILNVVFVIIIVCLLLILVIHIFEDRRKSEPILGLKDLNDTSTTESSRYVYVWKAIKSLIAPSTPELMKNTITNSTKSRIYSNNKLLVKYPHTKFK